MTSDSTNPPPIGVILGPTASGKSALSLRIAERFPRVEIVSADSRQIYRGLDIGTATPTRDELRAVRHHMIDIIEADQPFSAGDYAVRARRIIETILKEGGIPLVVGGSGFYVRALFEGLGAPAVDADVYQSLLEREQSEGADALRHELERIDPRAAAQHAANNRVKTFRALACYYQTGTRYSDFIMAASIPPWTHEPVYVAIARERSRLYRTIDDRVVDMLERGLLEETRGVLARGVDPQAPGLRTVGYRQVIDMLEGRIGGDEMVKQIQRATRRYAKRQMTWLKGMQNVVWISPSDEGRELQAAIEALGPSLDRG